MKVHLFHTEFFVILIISLISHYVFVFIFSNLLCDFNLMGYSDNWGGELFFCLQELTAAKVLN